jgi:hypothetical protein
MKYVLLPIFRLGLVIFYYTLSTLIIISYVLLYLIWYLTTKDLLTKLKKFCSIEDNWLIYEITKTNGDEYDYKTGFHWCIDIENKNGKYVGNKYRNRLL